MSREPLIPTIEVEISDTQRHLEVAPERLAHLVRRVLAGEGVRTADISIAVVDDAGIRTLNRRHLGHDWPTDVISFPLSEDEGAGAVLDGALVVSAEMAAATARRAGVDPWAELALYVVHGLLHLCGYDDRTAEPRDAMRRREGEVLAEEGLINTFPLAGLAEPADPGRESARWAV